MNGSDFAARPPQGRSARRQVQRASLDSHHVEVGYQPIVDVLTGSVTALEAQVRWQRPGGEALQGDAFGLYAESYGLVERIGDLAVRRVVADLARARSRGWDVGVTLRISALQVTALGFAAWLLDLLERAGVPAQRLTVDISESSLDLHPSLTRSALWALRNAGTGVQLSDIGSTAGSPLLLRVAPITGIKIDRFLTAQLLASVEAERVVGALFVLADSLSLDTVVAGVMSSAQLQVLRLLGCRRAVGPLWAEPKPLEQALQFNGVPRPRAVT